MHAWIGTDNGDQCYRCGAVLDYGETDEASGVLVDSDRTAKERAAAHGLLPFCPGPVADRAHHWTLIGTRDAYGYALDCAYGDGRIDGDTLPSRIAPDCIGG